METLSNPADKDEIIRRLRTIRPDTQRKWGKMSAHQMVCHLADGYRMYMNEKRVAPEAMKIPRTILKWVAIWAPVPWPHGFKTATEIDQQAGGTQPAAFDADLQELQNLIERFTRKPREFQYQVHPHFGVLSEKEWMRLGYLHPDHHLRQFGAMKRARPGR
jgi:Protein of unknown function (DUF1569)